MCLKCKPVPWSLADYEMAIKLKTEKIKPGEIVDGQMWIQVWQEIVNEKKTKRKTRKKLGEILDKLNQKISSHEN